ncbi:hypothetical protein [Noviherbaspirillum sp.]|uniref:hypothetical protein n=1 Tax=Noviherbaspirillum sp. TaxID=1926288 RepID=UPI002FDFFBDF
MHLLNSKELAFIAGGDGGDGHNYFVPPSSWIYVTTGSGDSESSYWMPPGGFPYVEDHNGE